MIKRKINCFFLLLFLGFTLIFSPLTVRAAQDSITSIDITADLMEDGSAHITQIWNTDVSDGTEFYIEQYGLGDIEIKDFMVSDVHYGQYENIGEWNIDASFKEKAGKCGINTTSNTIELCWGKTSLGDNTYTISYTMTNFVKEYADGAFGFYSRFVNSGMNPAPKNVSVTIQQDGAKFSTANAGIWIFGFKGEINFTSDGKIFATNDGPFTKDRHVTLLMRLDQSLVANAAPSDKTFSELQKIALEGSDYDIDEASTNAYEKPSSISSVFSLFILPILSFMAILGFSNSYKKAGDKSIAPPLNENKLAYYRDIPYKGYLPAAFFILNSYKKSGNKNNIINAYFLRWIKSGVVTVEKCPKKAFLGIGSKNVTSLVFHNAPANAGKLESTLYDIMIKAAGNDRILQENELKTWSQNNYTTLSAWFVSAEKSGKNYYEQNQLLTTLQQPYAFNLLKRTVTTVNDAGLQENKNLLGFKKYLHDYTLIKDRAPDEVRLWDEYLVFASLFGIADQVAKTFQKINPKFFEAPEYQQGGGRYDFLTTYMFLNTMSNASYQGMNAGHYASSGSRDGGGGGYSSFGGGGGGFSGGGFSGGSR